MLIHGSSVRVGLLVGALAALCLAGVGCNKGGPKPGGVDASAGGPHEDASGGGGNDAGPGIDAANDAGMTIRDDVVSIVIDPMDPVIDCDTTTPTQLFSAIATMSDGTMRSVTATWSIDTPRLGTMAPDGRFHGRDGCVASGRGIVTAEVTSLTGALVRATTSVTVRITRAPVLVGVDPSTDPSTHFAGTPGSGTASHLLYPLDGAVMPNNVLPPDIQWDGGAAGDVYRIVITNSTLTLTAYVLHTGTGFHYDWTPGVDVWRLAAENYSTEALQVKIDRWGSAADSVVAGTPISIRVMRSSIAGHVYYWDVGETTSAQGKIMRINAFDGTRDIVVPSPPVGPAGSPCMGCHAISRDGHYMAVMLQGGDPGARGTVFDLTSDLSGPSPTPLFAPQWSDPMGARWATATWSPDNTRLLYTDANVHLIDPMSGAVVPATGLPVPPPTGPTEATPYFFAPSWSPDGNNVAMGTMLTGVAWFHECTSGDLVIMPVTGSDTFGAVTRIHTGSSLTSAPEGGSVDSRPTWSPDSSMLAFQHGSNCAGDGGSGAATHFENGAIYVGKPDGTGVVRLDNAVGGAASVHNYAATFSPFVSSEGAEFANYYWIAFTSGRPYGNAQVGTAAHERRQIWVTAVRSDAGAGEDPSSVPYWLPGQDVGGQNMAAQWAPVACTATGDACTASSECCSGNCTDDGTGTFTCQAPPPAECHPYGSTCSTDADCCADASLICLGNTCLNLPR